MKEGMYWIKQKEGSGWEVWEGFSEPDASFTFTRRSMFIDMKDVHQIGDFIPTPED